MRPKRNRPEESLQRGVAIELETRLPPEYRWFHTPNERGGRSEVENKILKACGVKSGVADIIILHCTGRIVAWLELKAGRNQANENQKDWIDWLEAGGAPCAVCWSLEDVEAALERFDVPLAPRDRPLRLPPECMRGRR